MLKEKKHSPLTGHRGVFDESEVVGDGFVIGEPAMSS